MNSEERNVESIILFILQTIRDEEIEQVHAICRALRRFEDQEVAQLITVAVTEELLSKEPALSRWFLDVYFAGESAEMRTEAERILQAELICGVESSPNLRDRCISIARSIGSSLFQTSSPLEKARN